MTEKEKMEELIESGCKTLEELISHYLLKYNSEFSVSRLVNIVETLKHNYLYPKVFAQENALSVASERASYLMSYLSGNMYDSRESAEAALPIQIKNVETILESCKIQGGN